MKPYRWPFVLAAFTLAALLLQGGPTARSSAAVVGQVPAADQWTYEATAGGSAAITGFQVPGLVLTAEGNGIGRVAVSDAGATTLNTTVVVKAEIDVTQTPVLIKNGTLTLTAPNGDQVQGTFEGQGSVPDAAGFVNVAANFQITGGKGRYTGGGGTVTGLVNFAQSSFSITVRGTVVGAPTGS